MISFWTIAAAMLVAALLCVCVPLLRQPGEHENESQKDETVATNALVVSLHRKEWADAERDVLAGRSTKEEHVRRRLEIERRVLNDTARRSVRPSYVPGPGTRFGPCALLFVLIPALACTLYLKLGDPAALTLNDPPGADHGEQPGAIEIMVARLAYRLSDHAPDQRDADSWSVLARSYSVLERPADAVFAYAKAVALEPANAALRADFADALATANNGRIDARAAEQINVALSIDPTDSKALALAATAAFDTHAYGNAIGYWRRLQAGRAADSPIALQAQKDIANAIALSAITVNVTLGTNNSVPVAPDAVVTVTARATGVANGEVLAEQRFPASELPKKILLDDTQALQPSALSGNAKVTVDARIEGSVASGTADVAPAIQDRSANVAIAGGP